MIARRNLLHVIAGAGASGALGGLPAGAFAAVAKPSVPAATDHPTPPPSARDARLTWARLVGDLSGKPVFFFTRGTVWGFKPQADDLTVEEFARRIYGYSGVAARQFVRQADGGYKIRQKFWAFYRDPVTDAITDRIPNPYTGALDTAAPMSGPQTERPLVLGPDADGTMPFDMRVRRLGRTAVVETAMFQRIAPGGIGWHKLEGNIEDYVCMAAHLDDPARTHVPSFFSQNVIAEWQTWTKMHGTPGHILFKGNGEPLHRIEAIPVDQIAAIERFFPGSLAQVRAWR